MTAARQEYQCPLMECQASEAAGFEVLTIVDLRAHRPPAHPSTHMPEPLLTAFFSGVPLGEVDDSRFSRFISLLLGSLRVLFSSLMLAWCFSKKSCDLSRNWRRTCPRRGTEQGGKRGGHALAGRQQSFAAVGLTSTHLMSVTELEVRQHCIHTC